MNFILAFDVAHNVTNRIATLPTWGPYFKLGFEINLKSFGSRRSTRTNIIRYALPDGRSIPALTADTAGSLLFTTFINGAEITWDSSKLNINIKIDQWYEISMQQIYKNDKVTFCLLSNIS